MDNKIFNVNGLTKKQLAKAIDLLLFDEYDKSQEVTGWYYSKEKGLVLTWYVGDKYKALPFTDRMSKPAKLNKEELLEVLWSWLSSDEAKEVICEGSDANADHDGSNEKGWRLYVDNWGHIQETGHSLDHYSIAAFKPAYMWYGK